MTLKDNSSGTINITHGSPAPERANAGGFFTLGSGGGFGLGGSSSRRRNRRIRARQQAKHAAKNADAQRKALAQAAAEQQARANAMVHAQAQAAAAQAQLKAAQAANFHNAAAQAAAQHAASQQDPIKQIEQELRQQPQSTASSKTPGMTGLLRELDRVERLLASKVSELDALTEQANAFYGSNPLDKSVGDYLARLEQLAVSSPEADSRWRQAYAFGLRAQAQQQLINQLRHDRNQLAYYRDNLANEWAERHAGWAASNAQGQSKLQEYQRQQAISRAEIKTLHYVAQMQREARVNAANYLTGSVAVATAQPWLYGHAGIWTGTAASELAASIRQAITELARIATIETGQHAALFVTLMTYSPEAGRGSELSAQQRQRLVQQNLQALSVPLQHIVPQGVLEQTATAAENTEIHIPYRLRTEVADGVGRVQMAKTNAVDVLANVKVKTAVLDPVRQVYTLQSDGFPARTLDLSLAPARFPEEAASGYSGYQGITMLTDVPGVERIASGVPVFFDDLVVRFEPSTGIPPQYLMFRNRSADPQIVHGAGAPVSVEIREATLGARQSAIPEQIADQLRWASFDSPQALRSEVWRALAKQTELTSSLNGLNQQRMRKGLAPFAPKSEWVGDRRTIDFHYRRPVSQGGSPYDLDNIQLTGPRGAAIEHPARLETVLWAAADSEVAQRFAAQQLLLKAQAIALQAQALQAAALLAEAAAKATQAQRELQAWRTISVATASAVVGPQFLSPGVPIATLQGSDKAIADALRLAVAETNAGLAAGQPQDAGLIANLQYASADQAAGALAGFSTPLSSLFTGTFDAASTGAIDLPVRLGLVAENDEVILAAVAGSLAAGPVKVRAADYDAATNSYSATTDHNPAITLHWTPDQPPGAELFGPTNLPPHSPSIEVLAGPEAQPVDAQINEHPALEIGEIDDYIYWFPADSGLPPLYIVFKKREGPRYEPGIASGHGAVVEGIWLGEATRGEGAKIPIQVADQLRGRTFRDFDHFREHLWKAVSRLPHLVQQLSVIDEDQVRQGNAPFASKTEVRGGRQRFEIHHIHEIQHGGAVYDIENLVLLTPNAHINNHKARKP